MNILLISDIHFGARKNSEFFLNVTREFFKNYVFKAIKKFDISQLWILGDLFDDKITTNVLVENVVMSIFKKILKTFPNIEIKIIIGNHDVYYKNSLKVSSINIFSEQHDNRIEVINTIKKFNIDNRTIVAVPWLIHGSENWTEFTKIVSNYNENKKTYDYCFGHFAINGFEKNKGLVETKGLEQSMFKAFKKVYSGHFHIKSTLGHIQYLGSPYQITWNDFETKRGMTILNVESGKTTFIENKKSPQHKHIKLSSVLKDSTLLDDADNNIIKFHIDESINESDLNNILTKLHEKKIFNLQELDERYEDIDNDDVDIEEIIESDELQYMIEYVDQLNHPEEIDTEELKNRFAILFNKSIKETPQ